MNKNIHYFNKRTDLTPWQQTQRLHFFLKKTILFLDAEKEISNIYNQKTTLNHIDPELIEQLSEQANNFNKDIINIINQIS